MSFLRNIASGLRSLLRREQLDRELDEELGAYLEMEAAEKMRQGVSRKDALREVRLARGSLEVTKELVRSGGWEFFVESYWRDVRFGVRTLLKSPAFTTVVVLTLALGIGANTAIFTLIDAVMLKSLPVASPKQLYRLGGGSAAEPYNGEFVSGNYFTMLGIRAFAGRLFAPTDNSPGAPRVAVMNYHTWQRHFGLDPSVIGSTFNINGVPCTIAGVTPPGFYGDTLRSNPPDFWLPLVAEPNDRFAKR